MTTLRTTRVCLFLCLLLLPLSLWAQSDDPTLAVGLTPFQTYHGGNIDSVSLINGNLNIHVPILSYPQRGTRKLDFELVWNGKGMFVTQICPPHLTCTKVLSPQLPPVVVTDALSVSTRVKTVQQTVGGVTNNYSVNMLVTADGASHPEGLSSSGFMTTDGTGYFLGNYPTYLSGQTCSFNCNMIDRTGVQFSVDPNGNQVQGGLGTQNYTDTLGRVIPLLPNSGSASTTGDFTGCTGPLPTYSVGVWSVPAPSGAVANYKFCYARVTVGGTTSPCGTSVRTGTHTFTALQSILLPNGKSWIFEYNDVIPSTGYRFGNLTKITLPTGGSISYTYTTSCTLNTGGSYVTSRTVNANDGTGPHTWTYSWGGIAPAFLNIVTDPSGNDEVHTITSLDGKGAFYETAVQYYSGSRTSGTLLKTVSTDYTWANNPNSPYIGPTATSVLPIRVTTQWANGQVTKVEKTYDSGFHYASCCGSNEGTAASSPDVASYGNVIEERVYDYGSGAPGPLLRQADTQYLAFQNSNYLTANELDRPTTVAVYDGAGNLKSYTTYGYDEATPTGSGVTTGTTLPPYGNFRGNRTSVHRWLNTTNTYLTSTASFYDTGNLYQSTDPLGNTTTFTYSLTFAGAYPTQIQYPDTNSPNLAHHIVAKNYDFNTGLLASETDENGQVTSFAYDVMERTTQKSLPDGGQTTWAYDDNALTITATTAITATLNESATAYVDGLGRVFKVTHTDPDCSSTGRTEMDTTYDALGRKATVTNPFCSTSDATYGITSYQYDSLGRVVKEIPPDGTSSSNNVQTAYSGSCTTVTDQAGKQRESCTDGLGRLTQVFEAPNSLNYETDYSYDALGNLLGVTQKGSAPGDSTQWRTRSSSYDSLSRLLSTTNPESGTVSWTYDNDSDVLTKTDARGVVITYGYDALNRVTGKTYSNADPAVTYNYDESSSQGLTIANGIGRQTSMLDASGSSAWSYDKVGRTAAEQRTISVTGITSAPQTKSSNYLYNLDGSLAQINYPSGRAVQYSYNAAGHETAATDTTNPAQPYNYVATATYAPQGALAGANYGSAGIVLGDTYNNRLQPASITASSASGTIMSLNYSFNSGTAQAPINNGTLVKITNNVDPNRSQDFTYDALNRLASAFTDGPNWGDTYTIDAWGNLTNKTLMTGKTTGENLQQAANVKNQFVSFNYDLSGNTLNDGVSTYAYDAENRIRSGAGVQYVYDGNGERVAKATGPLYWAGTGNDALAESDTSGNLNHEYVFFNGKRVARVDIANGSVHFYFTDHLGSSSVVTDAAGTMSACGTSGYISGEEESDFFPYGGEVNYCDRLNDHRYKFTGKERDPETGADYFFARYYSNALGRFLTADWSATPVGVPYAKLGDPQSLNLYSYVENNPITGIDPDGHLEGDGGDPSPQNQPQAPQQSQQTPSVSANPQTTPITTTQQLTDGSGPMHDVIMYGNTTTTTVNGNGTTTTTTTITYAMFSTEEGKQGQYIGGTQSSKTVTQDSKGNQIGPSKETPTHGIDSATAEKALGPAFTTAQNNAMGVSFADQVSRDPKTPGHLVALARTVYADPETLWDYGKILAAAGGILYHALK